MALDPDFRQDDGGSGARAIPCRRCGITPASFKQNHPEMKRGCRGASLRPDNLLTWSAAGELQPGGPCVPPHPVSCTLIEGRYLPHMPSDISSASPERTEPNSLLNHETSDHLLSLVEKTRPSLTATAMCAGCRFDTSLVLQKISRNPQRLCWQARQMPGATRDNPRSRARSPPRRG